MLECSYAFVSIEISLNYGLGLLSYPLKEFAAELACVSKGIKCLGSVRCLQWDHLLAVLLPSAVSCSAGSRLCQEVCAGLNYIWKCFCLKNPGFFHVLCQFSEVLFLPFYNSFWRFPQHCWALLSGNCYYTINYSLYIHNCYWVLTFSSSSGTPCWLMHLHASCSWVGLFGVEERRDS